MGLAIFYFSALYMSEVFSVEEMESKRSVAVSALSTSQIQRKGARGIVGRRPEQRALLEIRAKRMFAMERTRVTVNKRAISGLSLLLIHF